MKPFNLVIIGSFFSVNDKRPADAPLPLRHTSSLGKFVSEGSEKKVRL